MAGNNAAGSSTSSGDSFHAPLSAEIRAGIVKKVDEVVGKAVLDGILGGGVVVGSLHGELVCSKAWGAKAPSGTAGEPVEIGTVFDLDSLTSAICTATLMMRLVDAGRISLSERACRYLQPLGVEQKALITVSQLLANTSGFGPAPELFEELTRANSGSRLGILSSSGAKQYAYSQCIKSSLRHEPGHRLYRSAVNSTLLGGIAEALTSLSLERSFHKYVAAPLQLKSLAFIDVAMLRRKNLTPVTDVFMPSGICSKRNKRIAGEVWDENTYIMGGVSGHSGLFGTARDVHAWGVEIVQALLGDSALITQRTAQEFWTVASAGSKPVARLGFDLPLVAAGFPDVSSAPSAGVLDNALGSSIFIDPARRAVVVILTNADYSADHNRRFTEVRSDIHSAILQ